MKVPLLDLRDHHDRMREEIDEAIARVLDAGAFCGGPFVEEFERAFAAFCGAEHAVGVGSGTEALWLVLLGLGIGPGDEVITVPNTFIATAEAISMTGATPVFVDVDEVTYTLDPDLLERAITPCTRAIIPVHLYGHPANMDPIMRIAAAKGIPVVEDACQAHGAVYRDRMAGAIGRAGCFSFYPSKNLGALGEAGAVVTSNSELAGQIRMIRDHGQARKDSHAVIGWNARMDGIQAAVLSVKLRRLPDFIAARRELAARYNELLADVPGVLCPVEAPYARHVYHVYAVRTSERDAIMQAATQSGIGCRIHYPVPIHLQPAYASLGYTQGDFPVCEQTVAEELSLPMYPELTGAGVAYVAETIRMHGERRLRRRARASTASVPAAAEAVRALEGGATV